MDYNIEKQKLDTMRWAVNINLNGNEIKYETKKKIEFKTI